MNKYYRLIDDPEEISRYILGTGQFSVPGVLYVPIMNPNQVILVPVTQDAIFELAKQFDIIGLKYWSIDDVDIALAEDEEEDELSLSSDEWTTEMKKDVWELVKNRKDELEDSINPGWDIFHDAIRDVMADYENGCYD